MGLLQRVLIEASKFSDEEADRNPGMLILLLVRDDGVLVYTTFADKKVGHTVSWEDITESNSNVLREVILDEVAQLKG